MLLMHRLSYGPALTRNTEEERLSVKVTKYASQLSLFLLYTLISKDEKKIVEGGNRTTVNAIVRVSI